MIPFDLVELSKATDIRILVGGFLVDVVTFMLIRCPLFGRSGLVQRVALHVILLLRVRNCLLLSVLVGCMKQLRMLMTRRVVLELAANVTALLLVTGSIAISLC